MTPYGCVVEVDQMTGDLRDLAGAPAGHRKIVYENAAKLYGSCSRALPRCALAAQNARTFLLTPFDLREDLLRSGTSPPKIPIVPAA